MAEGVNSELIRRAYDAWNRDAMSEFLALLDPEVEWHTSGRLPDVELVYRGHEEVLEFFRDFKDPWESIEIEPEEIREAGDIVVVRVRFRAKGRAGIEVDLELIHVYTIRDGKCLVLRSYEDHATALADAGIEAP